MSISTEDSQDEPLTEFREDILEEIDILRLEPVTIKSVLIISVSMLVPGIVFIVLFAIYQTVWFAILLIVAAGLIIMGSYLFFFEYSRLSDDKNVYIFSRDGFKTERVDGEHQFISWKEIEDLKIKGRYGPQKRKRRCIITTKSEEIKIIVNGFNEVTAKSKHPDTILREILKYYERMKETN